MTNLLFWDSYPPWSKTAAPLGGQRGEINLGDSSQGRSWDAAMACGIDWEPGLWNVILAGSRQNSFDARIGGGGCVHVISVPQK